ncbi:MAG: hypothetical protein O3A01_02710 [bacterium]|nr:hypothetical protein [bacterium]
MAVSSINPTPPPFSKMGAVAEATEAGRNGLVAKAQGQGASLNDPGVFSNVAVAVEQMKPAHTNAGDKEEKLVETTEFRQTEIGALAGQRSLSAQAAAATADDGVQAETNKVHKKMTKAKEAEDQGEQENRRSKGLLEAKTEEPSRLKRAASTGDIVALQAQERHNQNKGLKRTKSMSEIALDVADEALDKVDTAMDVAKKVSGWAGVGGIIGTAIAPGVGTVAGTAIGAVIRLGIEAVKRL